MQRRLVTGIDTKSAANDLFNFEVIVFKGDDDTLTLFKINFKITIGLIGFFNFKYGSRHSIKIHRRHASFWRWSIHYLCRRLSDFADGTFAHFAHLLLHDMGERLADGEGEWRRYWRTAPLWAIGVQKQVAANAGFLHDGRARTLLEAILWHSAGGQT